MTTDASPRRGRRKRSALPEGGTRGAIVTAAAAEFATSGYDGTSMRGVARRAGVDPALVHHYFDGKADLFTAAISVEIRPHRIVAEVLAGPRDAIGSSVVRAVITRFDVPGTSGPVMAMVRAALGHEFAARMLRQFLMREVLQRIVEQLDVPDGETRAALAGTQVIGLLVARYGLHLEPVAQASVDELVARVGPVLQWYLTGDPQSAPAG